VPTYYSITLSASDVGRRVMVRRTLDDGREGYGDVVGELVEWLDTTLTIRTRGGEHVVVAHDAVVAGKVVPPPVKRSR
jgi:hypothetical protein